MFPPAFSVPLYPVDVREVALNGIVQRADESNSAADGRGLPRYRDGACILCHLDIPNICRIEFAHKCLSPGLWTMNRVAIFSDDDVKDTAQTCFSANSYYGWA